MTAVKPNRGEANQPWQEPVRDPLRDEALLQVGKELLREWKPDHLLITLGEQGMILFDRDQPPYHVPSRAREVYDLSGAGDTAIALFTLDFASDASPIEGAEISNHARSVVVGKLGTATLSSEELLESFRLEIHKPNLSSYEAAFLNRGHPLIRDVGYCSEACT
jgi:D-beta-D-heptose 7-phosphate kinase/D-beta-D-heptose 1-phosphate adenosyltransferase